VTFNQVATHVHYAERVLRLELALLDELDRQAQQAHEPVSQHVVLN
jgi:hypothetical protein